MSAPPRRNVSLPVAAAVAALAASPLLLSPATARAQQADTAAAADTAGASAADSAVYRREVFSYPTQRRRDPFRPLQSFASSGPRLDELTLSGILHGGQEGGSVVVLLDPSTGSRYRLRVGDSVGFARLTRVEPRQAVFTVRGFGRDRNVVLRLEQDQESSP